MDDSSNESFTWTDEIISKLIKLRYEKRDEFKSSGKRGSTHDAWMNVVRDLRLENQISVLAVRKKWNSLLNKFKDIENKIAIGSCSEDVAWPHYNQMQTIMNELSSQENPSILATGNNNETVKIQFSDVMNNDGVENEDENQEHKPSKRDRRDIIDERFIAAIEEGNEQLKTMNGTLEKQGEAFLQLMSRLVSAMETQVADDASMSGE